MADRNTAVHIKGKYFELLMYFVLFLIQLVGKLYDPATAADIR